jgi:hypothetical protein
MPPMDQQEFKFPDEIDSKPGNKTSDMPEIEIEIEDDTPVEDRNKAPMPKPLVEELEKDELDQYDDTVKEKLKQMRKVWHDERRDKEAALREQQEAIAVAQKLIEENKRIKTILTTGEKEYVTTVQRAAQLELDAAKRAYKEAYDAGDTDKVIDAQQAMQQANLKVMQAENFKLPPLQEENFEVQTPQQVQQPTRRSDAKAEEWQERNSWFGSNRGMTAYALGLHEELKENGVVVGSDDYYSALDNTMRKRFPEAFGISEEEQTPREPARTKPATVVAPASRSTAPQKVRLKTSQLNLIKKLGITPEQYVKEYMKEARNG